MNSPPASPSSSTFSDHDAVIAALGHIPTASFDQPLNKKHSLFSEDDGNGISSPNDPSLPLLSALEGLDDEQNSKRQKKNYPWLIVVGEPCHSSKQMAAGVNLSHTKKKYRRMQCLYCAEFNNSTPWASIKPRKYEFENFEEHEKSAHHRKALVGRNAYMADHNLQPESAYESTPLMSNIIGGYNITLGTVPTTVQRTMVVKGSRPLFISNPTSAVTYRNNVPTMNMHEYYAQQIQPEYITYPMNEHTDPYNTNMQQRNTAPTTMNLHTQQQQQQQQQQHAFPPPQLNPNTHDSYSAYMQIQMPQMFVNEMNNGANGTAGTHHGVTGSSSGSSGNGGIGDSWIYGHTHGNGIPPPLTMTNPSMIQQQQQQQQAYHMMNPLESQNHYHNMQDTMSALTPSHSSYTHQPQHQPHHQQQHHQQQHQVHSQAHTIHSQPQLQQQQLQQQQQQQQQRLMNIPHSMIVNPNTMSTPLNPLNQRSHHMIGGNMSVYPPIGIMLSEASNGMPSLPPPPINSTTIPTTYPLGYNNKPTLVQPLYPPPPPPPPAMTNPTPHHQSFIPDWLTSQGKFCFSDKQISSGKDLTGMKKKYKLVMCSYCAEFLPDTPWATMRPRKYETAVFLEHDRSTHHKKASEAKLAKVPGMKTSTGNINNTTNTTNNNNTLSSTSSSSSRLHGNNTNTSGNSSNTIGGEVGMGNKQGMMKQSSHSNTRSTPVTTTNHHTTSHSNNNSNRSTHPPTTHHNNHSTSSSSSSHINNNTNSSNSNSNSHFNGYEFVDAYLNPANASVLPFTALPTSSHPISTTPSTTTPVNTTAVHTSTTNTTTPSIGVYPHPTSSQHTQQQPHHQQLQQQQQQQNTMLPTIKHMHPGPLPYPSTNTISNPTTTAQPSSSTTSSNSSSASSIPILQEELEDTNTNTNINHHNHNNNHNNNSGFYDNFYESLTNIMHRNDLQHIQSVVNAMFVDPSGTMQQHEHGHDPSPGHGDGYYPTSSDEAVMMNMNHHHPMYAQQLHQQQQQQAQDDDGNSYPLGMMHTTAGLSNPPMSRNISQSSGSGGNESSLQQQQQSDASMYDEQMMINTALLQLIQSSNGNYGLEVGSVNASTAYSSSISNNNNNMVGIMGGSNNTSRQGSMKSGTLTGAPFSFSDITALGESTQ